MASGVRVGICHSTVDDSAAALAAQCKSALLISTTEDDVVVSQVPGVLDLPYAASRMILTQGVDVVVCIGTINAQSSAAKGGGRNFDTTLQTVSQGIMRLSLESGIPVISGVVGFENESEVTICLLNGQSFVLSSLFFGPFTGKEN
jgi:6,7-dimethyl-8-ribityllumazine synthase